MTSRQGGQQQLVPRVLCLLALLACTRCSPASGSVVNDVNNMLRDNGATAGGHIGRKHVPAAPREMLRNGAVRRSADTLDEQDLLEDETSVELLRFVSDDDEQIGRRALTSSSTAKTPATTNSDYAAMLESDEYAGGSDAGEQQLDARALQSQVRLLSKQLNALMTRRREDYELLEHNLRKSLRITTNAATVDLDIRHELEQLRHEVKSLRDVHLNGNKERLTVEWLQQSVSELRKQLVELQQMASNAAKDVSHRAQSYEDLATVRSDFQQLKLELTALKERQQQSEVYVRELRDEALQQEEDYKRLLHNKHSQHQRAEKKFSERTLTESQEQAEQQSELATDSNNVQLSSAMLADHQRRHCRFQHQQIHELQQAQHSLKRQLNELKYHRIGERVRSIEIEQHRIADANFNLSRQIASLDKLHSSMLELLEDVEDLQNKMDKNVPELRHEISKLEFSTAQLTSEQSLVREEGKNVARSVQAMAVSVSTLQDERDSFKQTQSSVTQLQSNVDRLQSILQDVQRALRHHHKDTDRKLPNTAHHQQPHEQQHSPTNNNNNNNNSSITSDVNYSYAPMTQHAESLVAKLENVEEQYESIIDKLPEDCGEVSSNGQDGLYLIAPAGQHHPLMAHCAADGWTTVQRRFDGSADFNRSWEDYAAGFGAPAGEYWIGNEQLHHLTLNNCTSLRVLMQDIYDNVWLAEYGRFYISSRADGYRLQVGGYSGNASDALDYQQDMQFSAIDVDRDISQTHCAANYEGGWWFSHCQHANLNGRYNLGLTWFDAARNEWIAVKSSQMLIKRRSAAVCGYAAAVDADSSLAAAAEAAVAAVAPTTTTGSTIVSSKSTDEADATTPPALVADAPV